MSTAGPPRRREHGVGGGAPLPQAPPGRPWVEGGAGCSGVGFLKEKLQEAFGGT